MHAAFMQILSDKVRGAFKSLTIWFNSLMAFLAFGLPELAVSLPLIAGYLPDDLRGHVTLLTIVGNIFIRFITRKPLEEK